MEHWFHGILASFMTWLLSIHFFAIVIINIPSLILPAIVSIIGGIITGFLSKLLNRFFINQAKDDVIRSQASQIIKLQNQIQSTK
jgi:uncharacterized membrane protein (DUF106 family)